MKAAKSLLIRTGDFAVPKTQAKAENHSFPRIAVNLSNVRSCEGFVLGTWPGHHFRQSLFSEVL